jgi:hypothetical protein
MTLSEAIQILTDVAGRWAENAEESFCFRIKAEDSDEECQRAAGDDCDIDDVKEIRSIWQAIEVASTELNKSVEPAPR